MSTSYDNDVEIDQEVQTVLRVDGWSDSVTLRIRPSSEEVDIIFFEGTRGDTSSSLEKTLTFEEFRALALRVLNLTLCKPKPKEEQASDDE